MIFIYRLSNSSRISFCYLFTSCLVLTLHQQNDFYLTISNYFKILLSGQVTCNGQKLFQHNTEKPESATESVTQSEAVDAL